MYEEAEYIVRITLTTNIAFSPMERESKITRSDAIENGFGTMPQDVWDALEAEGWNIEADAERVTVDYDEPTS